VNTTRRARKVRDPQHYVAAVVAAKALRELADNIEQRDQVCLVKWHLNVSYWYFEEGAPRRLLACSRCAGQTEVFNECYEDCQCTCHSQASRGAADATGTP